MKNSLTCGCIEYHSNGSIIIDPCQHHASISAVTAINSQTTAEYIELANADFIREVERRAGASRDEMLEGCDLSDELGEPECRAYRFLRAILENK